MRRPGFCLMRRGPGGMRIPHLQNRGCKFEASQAAQQLARAPRALAGGSTGHRGSEARFPQAGGGLGTGEPEGDTEKAARDLLPPLFFILVPPLLRYNSHAIQFTLLKSV